MMRTNTDSRGVYSSPDTRDTYNNREMNHTTNLTPQKPSRAMSRNHPQTLLQVNANSFNSFSKRTNTITVISNATNQRQASRRSMNKQDKLIYSSNDLLDQSQQQNNNRTTLTSSQSHMNSRSRQQSNTQPPAESLCARNLLMSRTKDQDFQTLQTLIVKQTPGPC